MHPCFHSAVLRANANTYKITPHTYNQPPLDAVLAITFKNLQIDSLCDNIGQFIHQRLPPVIYTVFNVLKKNPKGNKLELSKPLVTKVTG